MNRIDYIRQVDSLDLPAGLYGKLAALPTGQGTWARTVRPHGRWAAIAAALVLVVGLGVATPALIHLFTTGGDITVPPPATPATTALPAAPDPWGITLRVEDVTGKGLTLVCEQFGGAPTGELLTGSWYRVDRLEGGQWREVPIIAVGNIAWTSEGWIIPMDGTQRWSVNWEWLYGTLLDGTYRIAKNVLDSRAPGDYDNKDYFAEFTVGPTPVATSPDVPKKVLEAVQQRYDDDYRGTPQAAYVAIQSCEPVADYGTAFYGEDSSAYRVVVAVAKDWVLERYFVFDGDLELLNVAESAIASPWESYQGALMWVSIEGILTGGHFSELDGSIRESLEDTGETSPYSITPWNSKVYCSASLEITTVTAPKDLLEQRLAEGSIDRALYDEVLGTEYIYQVRPLDGAYPTGGGLRIGDTLEQARELFYNLSDNDTYIKNVGMGNGLTVTTENGVVTDIIVMGGARTIGKAIFY